MAFKYTNPGYAELFYNTKGHETIASMVYNPNSGVAIRGSDAYISTILPAGYFSTGFYLRIDIYVDGSPNNYGNAFSAGLTRAGYSEDTGWISGINSNDGYIYILSGTNRLVRTNSRLKSNSLNKILFHLNISEATAELNVNGEEATAQNLSYMTNGYYGANSDFIIRTPYSSSCTYYVSNIIISEDEILPKEAVIALPISATATDMTARQDGIYIADAVNQSLLQTPDVAALIESYGAGSTVTGVAVVGNPAYRTGTGITTLTSLSKTDTVITEHNSLALSDDTIATIKDGWTISNATIADLANMQFGWRAGE